MQISYLHHLERVAPVVRQSHEKIEYYRIAAHYRFIMRTMFDCFKYPRLIILEVRLGALDFWVVGTPRPDRSPADTPEHTMSCWAVEGSMCIRRNGSVARRCAFWWGETMHVLGMRDFRCQAWGFIQTANFPFVEQVMLLTPCTPWLAHLEILVVHEVTLWAHPDASGQKAVLSDITTYTC